MIGTLRVLVTGASGFIGGALVRRWSHPTIEVIAPVRRHISGTTPAVLQPVIGAMDDATDWTAILDRVDVIAHCAAQTCVPAGANRSGDALKNLRQINVAATLNLARQAAQGGVRRFVFISSVKVNGEETAPDHSFTAADAPQPQDAYAISKLEAEQGLLELARHSGMEVVIIRPPLVYGPGVKGNFASMMSWVRKGYPIPLGAVYNQRSRVALDNLVDFIALCADRTRSPRAANQVFLISDGEHVSTPELLRRVSRAYGVPSRLWPVPQAWLRLAARLLGQSAAADRLLGSLVVDSSKARDLLGWRPGVTMEDQLRKMALHDQGV